MIHVICGSNPFAIKSRLAAIEQDFLAENDRLALQKIDGSEANFSDIVESLQALSLFVPRKMIIVSDLSSNKASAERLGELVGLASEQAILVIVESSLDKRSTYYKRLKKIPGFKEFSELSELELKAWAQKYIQGHGGSISATDATYLIDRVGTSQINLQAEIDKLLAYNGTISRREIDLLTEPTLKSTIFNLIDSVFSGDLKKALLLYDEQRAQKVEPQAILGMIIWQMHTVVMCAAYGQSSAQTIASESGVSPYVIGKAQTIARQMGVSNIKRFLGLLAEIDIASKTKTYNLDDALKFAITTLA